LRKQFVWTVAIGAGIYGAAIGCLGGSALQFAPQISELAIGAFIGGATGLGGGWLLGRRLASVCWGSSKTNSEGP